MTDGTGVATWQAAYEAFGTRTAEQGVNAERHRANTKDEDPTGLLNEGFRYRDLATGVFISRDPAGFVDGPNVYTYVRQNPWTRFDALGLWETDSYWGDVGKFYTGFGKAAANLAVGVAKSVVELPSNLAVIGQGIYDNATDANVRAQAGETLSDTGSDIKAGLSNYGDKLARGDMETLGDATFQVLALATPIAASKATAAAEATNAARVMSGTTGMVDDVTNSARAVQGAARTEAGVAAGEVGAAAGTGAESVNAGSALRSKLSALEDAQSSAVRTRTLQDGRVRYYGEETLARTVGPTRGASYVTEHNPRTGGVRSWMENYNHSGDVNRVHPKMKNGQQVDSQHYPPTAKELGK